MKVNSILKEKLVSAGIIPMEMPSTINGKPINLGYVVFKLEK